jgi:hypothetical protein
MMPGAQDSPQVAATSPSVGSDTRVLATATLACGILSWIALPIPLLEVAAIVMGTLMLKREGASQQDRRRAKIGLAMGIFKCLVFAVCLVWVLGSLARGSWRY